MTIDRDLWQRARPLFDEIVDLEPDARRARLETIGKTDPAMRDAIERLLQADGYADEKLSGYDFAAASHSASTPINLDPLGIVGRTVSHFKMTEFVAAGGMGVVYKAADVTLGRVVAIKFPLPHQRLDDEAKERFIHEARSVAALDHPNLCTVYEFGESPHGLYLAMPFYQGETLKDRIARERVVPVADAVRIARQVAAGLSSAHAAGIVHRDLKPGNVMLLPDGSVKILDFGIAKVRDVQLTRSGVALGTIAYMAPGQAAGESADAQADLWAIGVMLYEMLTGVLPFRGPNEMAILHAIVHVEPEPASRLNKEVLPALDAIVSGLLQKNPTNRYSSASALLADLDAATAGAPVTHRPPAATRFARLRRRRLPLAVAGALALVGVAWVGRTLLRGQILPNAAAASSITSERTVAVLPFVNREGNVESAYLASGLTDELIAMLGRAGGVRIAGRSSAEELQREGLAAGAIAQRLGVGHLVDGTLRVASDTFHLGVRLTHMPDGVQLWTGNFNAPVAQLIALERQVADSVLEKLHSGSRVAPPPLTTDPVVYDRYLKARYAWGQRTEESLKEAIVYYRGALERDPRFAPAYAGMAEAYVNMSDYGWGMSHAEALARADVAANQAIALDASLDEAYVAEGAVLMSRRAYRESEASLQRAIQLNPNSPFAHHYYSLLLQMLGRAADSKGEAERVLAIDPLSALDIAHLGVVFASQGRLPQGREQLQNALRLSPNHTVALHYLGAVEAALGNYPAAEKWLRQGLSKSAGFPGGYGALAYTYTMSGRADQARRVMADARAAVSDERSRVNYALDLALTGQSDSAFAMLGTADWDIPTLIELRSDPLLRPFRANQRYAPLLARWNMKP